MCLGVGLMVETAAMAGTLCLFATLRSGTSLL